MTDSPDATRRISLLTEKEREALRLVQSHGTVHEIARALGITPTAAKKRLLSAGLKLGTSGRHATARLFLAGDGPAGFPKGSVPIEHLAPPADAPFPEATGEATRNAVHEDRADYAVGPPTWTKVLLRLLNEPGERHDLTIGQQLRGILVWTLIGIVAFCLLLALLDQFSRTAHAFFPPFS